MNNWLPGNFYYRHAACLVACSLRVVRCIVLRHLRTSRHGELRIGDGTFASPFRRPEPGGRLKLSFCVVPCHDCWQKVRRVSATVQNQRGREFGGYQRLNCRRQPPSMIRKPKAAMPSLGSELVEHIRSNQQLRTCQMEPKYHKRGVDTHTSKYTAVANNVRCCHQKRHGTSFYTCRRGRLGQQGKSPSIREQGRARWTRACSPQPLARPMPLEGPRSPRTPW